MPPYEEYDRYTLQDYLEDSEDEYPPSDEDDSGQEDEEEIQ